MIVDYATISSLTYFALSNKKSLKARSNTIQVDPLKVLEKQSGILRLLVYLAEDGEEPLTEVRDDTDIPVHQLYSSIEKCKEMGLVKTRIDNTKYPPKNLIYVTEKGRKVAGKLNDVVDIIKGHQG